MKKRIILLPVFCLTQLSLNAQVTVVAPTTSPPPAASNVVVVRSLDPVIVRQQLSLPPKVIVVNQSPVFTPVAPVTQVQVTPVTPAPQTALKTTKTTTVVDTPGQPRRVYNSERNVVVVLEDQGQSRELPYVTLPVLFVKETNELLDQESRAALQEVAGVITAVSQAEPGTQFDIEGHTSTDGTDEFNLSLSAMRAQRIFDELTQNYGIPASLLSAHGYGESFPMYPQGSEDQMQLDRRVLVVRTK
jgi:outer membrane protein OmpA-like peptidoglycan-associated protein